MGKAARRRRQAASSGRGAHARIGSGGDPGGGDLKGIAEAALARLIKMNPPGTVSLAGAYALGYGGLAMAQIEGDGPDWLHDLDPLETLFLGTAWPEKFRDSYEFANACYAWLQLLRDTVHWNGIGTCGPRRSADCSSMRLSGLRPCKHTTMRRIPRVRGSTSCVVTVGACRPRIECSLARPVR